MSEHIPDFFGRLATLQREGTPVAVATVVSRRAPVSSHLGDRALVFADGRMEGFVGGSCSRDIVRRQAVEALAAGKPRLVRIRPDASEPSHMSPDAESVVVPMTCASEGASDVYVEPILPPKRLVVVGFTPVARAVATLARSLEYEVTRVVEAIEVPSAELDGVKVVALEDFSASLRSLPSAARGGLVVVVASQGHYDEEALEAALRVKPAFLGLLASRKRAEAVRTVLRDVAGLTEEDVSSVRNPVGLDIGAKTPAEVAVSILAEIVQARPFLHVPSTEASSPPLVAIDPVCGMDVEVATAKHAAEHDGVMFYFCCPHCKARFVKDPAKYPAGAAS